MKDEQITRLNKYLALCNVCSRRDADKLIEQQAVTINGIVASPGIKVTGSEKICVQGKPISAPEEKVILAYYKPMGVVCTERDKHARITLRDSLQYPVRLTYAGRLDKDSEGLLIMTNDGALIDAMMRGANRHEKEYLVKVDKSLTGEALAQMRAGIYLEELKVTTRACKIEQTGPYTMKMVLTQGLNRQIRRMCETVGYRVKSLKRTRVMNIELKSLKPGGYRELTEEEKQILYRDCAL